jgi:hypothetical protein
MQLSDSVFELYKPESIAVGLEVVFIHGLDHDDCVDAHWKTWLARDGTPNNVWPRTWLTDEFSSARVFSLSYDACIEQTATDGRMDLYVLGENIVQEMVDLGGIGQNGVPVVFVCHGFGGLVAKQIVVSGEHRFAKNAKVQNLLQMIDAFCFYSTPHHGSDLAKSPLYLKQGWLNLHRIFGAKSPLLGNFEVLDTERSRINSEFEKCKHPSWHFCVVAETHETPEVSTLSPYVLLISPMCIDCYDLLVYDFTFSFPHHVLRGECVMLDSMVKWLCQRHPQDMKVQRTWP